MTEIEAKKILYHRIKCNLLSNGRNAEDEKVKEICSAWWLKCKKYCSKTEEAWETSFDKAEDRKQGIIMVYDFTLEVDAYSRLNDNKVMDDVKETVTREFSAWVTGVFKNPSLPPKNLYPEYIRLLNECNPTALEWWVSNVGDIRN